MLGNDKLQRWQLIIAIIGAAATIAGIVVAVLPLGAQTLNGLCTAPTNVTPRLSNRAYWMRNSWDAFTRGEHAEAISNVNACLSDWTQEAARQQTAIQQAPPFGAVSSADAARIHANGVLNDVGTSYWILGQSHRRLGQTAEARSAYASCMRYTHARTLDRADDTFWRPSASCEDQLNSL